MIPSRHIDEDRLQTLLDRPDLEPDDLYYTDSAWDWDELHPRAN